MLTTCFAGPASASAGGGFDPSKVALTGVLWLDASAASTLYTDVGGGTTGVASDGDLVGTWRNRFGGQNADAVDNAHRPTYKTGIVNSKPVVRFDGSATHMHLDGLTAASGPLTVFAVYVTRGSSPGAGVSNMVMDIQTGRLVIAAWGSDGVNLGYYDGGWHNIGAQVIDTPQAISYVLSTAAGGVVRRDGASLGSDTYSEVAIGGSIGLGADSAGTGSFAHIDLCEFIIYSGSISKSDHNKLGQHLTAKWGLTWTTIP